MLFAKHSHNLRIKQYNEIKRMTGEIYTHWRQIVIFTVLQYKPLRFWLTMCAYEQ